MLYSMLTAMDSKINIPVPGKQSVSQGKGVNPVSFSTQMASLFVVLSAGGAITNDFSMCGDKWWR